MSWFSNLFTSIEKAITPIAAATPQILSAAEAGAAIVSEFVPKAAPVIQTVESIAPTVINDVGALIARGKDLLANPAVAELESILGRLTHLTATPQSVVVTPLATAATVPAPPPGAAVS